MDAHELLRQSIDRQQGRLAAGIPPGREAALLALVAAIDRLPVDREPDVDLAALLTRTGRGVMTALGLCLDSGDDGQPTADAASWAEGFLDACRMLETARLVLRFAASGDLRLVPGESGGLDAWFPAGRLPALWRERRDLARWAREGPVDPTVPMAGMSWQLPYPAGSQICGIPVVAFHEILAALHDFGTGEPGGGPRVIAEDAAIEAIASSTQLGVEFTRRVFAAFTLDRDAADWHAALPGGPQPPLVRIGRDRLVVSRRGLRSEPLLFAARELRRRDPERYHNDAHGRETVFRRDLYARFADRRFVISPDRIVLRRDDRRNRTDIDAAMFDRKTGTLAVYELKSQDPYPRTGDEAERQRENLARAGQQVDAMLDWIRRNGADEVLNRMDRAAARRFRVQRVLAFVLGRCRVDAVRGDGRGGVAWGSWGQVLRLMEGASGGNPLLALHTRLLDDTPATFASDAAPVSLVIGGLQLVVHADWAAVQRRHNSRE